MDVANLLMMLRVVESKFALPDSGQQFRASCKKEEEKTIGNETAKGASLYVDMTLTR
jgi:hypothetical protein